MDISTTWLIVLSLATPIAGVVGFAIQLRNVKKLRLQNQKLELEIYRIQKEINESESPIKIASNDEVVKYAGPGMFNMRPDPKLSFRNIFDTLMSFLFVCGIILLCVYFVYDLYRFFSWVVF